MTRDNHIIRRQALEVKITSGENVAAVHDRVRNIYMDKVIPSLDTLFSGLSDDEVILRINNLQLDLGTIEADKLEEQFTEKTLRALRESLEKKLQFDITDQDMQLVRRQGSFADAFFYFLELGQLPWWCEIKDLGILEKEISDQSANYVPLKNKLAGIIANQPESVRRLSFQFSDEFLEFVTQLYLPSFKPVELLKEMRHFLVTTTNTDPVYLRDLFWQIICKHIILSPERLHAVVIKGLLHIACEKHNLSRTELNRLVGLCEESAFPHLHSVFSDSGENTTEMVKEKTAADSSQHTAAAEENAYKPAKDDSDSKAKPGGIPTVAGQKDGQTNKGNRDLQEKLHYAGKNGPAADTNDQQRDDGNHAAGVIIYPGLAGLVILHPFLSSFFAGLKLTDGKKFLDEDALYKAVALLGYMATGEIEVQEQRLVIPKLFCGMDLSAPVKKNVLIGDSERDEADKLLNAVIAHWTALKNTSASGLRDTFLKREGKLSRTDNGWQLEIERKTWDILLSRLPWGFSMIKFPWMNDLIFVNWG
jgi:hypothetical protein